MQIPAPQEQSFQRGHAALFSFVDSLLNACDAKLLTVSQFEQLLQQWGRDLGAQMNWTDALMTDLDCIAEALRQLGLVRVFEPSEEQTPQPHILVMRCLFSRYVTSQRLQQGKSKVRILPSIVNGMLAAAGHKFQVKEQVGPTLRQDEYILSLLPRAEEDDAQRTPSSDFQFVDLLGPTDSSAGANP